MYHLIKRIFRRTVQSDVDQGARTSVQTVENIAGGDRSTTFERTFFSSLFSSRIEAIFSLLSSRFTGAGADGVRFGIYAESARMTVASVGCWCL